MQTVQQLVLLLLLGTAITVLSKKLQCTNQASLRHALVDEGLEATLGYLGNSSVVQKMVANLQLELTDPLERYERIMCPSKTYACMSCKLFAKSSPYNLQKYARIEVNCHLKQKPKCRMHLFLCLSNLDCQKMEEALFLLNAKTFAEFTPMREIDTKLVAFLSAYSPEFDVYADSLVGKVHQKEDGARKAQLVKTDKAFSSNMFNFGQRYVGCTELKYVHKKSGTTALRFYACKEFILQVSNAAGIVFLYHMYHQAERQPKISKPLLARFFDLFDEFMEEMEKNIKLQAVLNSMREQLKEWNQDEQANAAKIEKLVPKKNHQVGLWAKSDKALDGIVEKLIDIMTPAVEKSRVATESKTIQVVSLAQAYLQGHANTLFSITASSVGTMFKGLNQCASVSMSSRYAASANCGIENFIIEADASE